jgi:hypothetical protein
LNAFDIPYRVVHDEDRAKPNELATNARIAAAAAAAVPPASTYMLSPDDLEGVLGSQVSKGAGKPYEAVKKVEELFKAKALPQALIDAVNFAYFGTTVEPTNFSA